MRHCRRRRAALFDQDRAELVIAGIRAPWGSNGCRVRTAMAPVSRPELAASPPSDPAHGILSAAPGAENSWRSNRFEGFRVPGLRPTSHLTESLPMTPTDAENVL